MAKHDHIDNRQSVKYKVIKTAAYSGLHCLGLTKYCKLHVSKCKQLHCIVSNFSVTRPNQHSIHYMLVQGACK